MRIVLKRTNRALWFSSIFGQGKVKNRDLPRGETDITGGCVLNGRHALRWLGPGAEYGERVLGTI